MTRDLRFGLNLIGQGDLGEVRDQVKWADDHGVDVVVVPDHLGVGAPIPMMLAAAQVSPTIRVGTFVLSTPFYNPHLLARDFATVDRQTEGRIEIGLGAGYVEQEFAAAGIPFPSAGARVDNVTSTLSALRNLLTSDTHWPRPLQSPPPLLVAGTGDRILKAGAQHADIIAISDAPSYERLAERVGYVRTHAGERFPGIELNLGFFDIAIGRDPDLGLARVYRPGETDVQILASPTFLHGPKTQVVERLVQFREELGISYFTYIGANPAAAADFATLIAEIRR